MATWAREACHPLFPKAASTATAIEALTPRDMFLGSLKNIPQTGTSIIETQTRQIGRSRKISFQCQKKHTKKTHHKIPGYETGLQTSNIRDCKICILQFFMWCRSGHDWWPNFPNKPGLISCAFFIRHVCGDLFGPILPAILKEMQTADIQ